MPNHVTNRLTIQGSPEDVAKVFDSIAGSRENGEPMYIDFNKIKPLPEALNIESGSSTDVGLALYCIANGIVLLDRWSSYESRGIEKMLEDENLPKTDDGVKRFASDTQRGQELYALGETVMSNIQNYGAKTWYEWCNREWGTKWNAYYQDKVNENTIEFCTAWSGVPELLSEISMRYPEVVLEYMFADEDWGYNTGHHIFNGKSASYDEIENGSPEALAIAGELLGPCPWEEDS